jgi:UDP-2,3-diacylglucosamine pyrophosphatase LpxH
MVKVNYAGQIEGINSNIPDDLVVRYTLGTRSSRARSLLGFLKDCDGQTIYLAGDIFDGWALKRSWFWTLHHNDVVPKLLRKARKGTKIINIPGNHDAMAAQFAGLLFGGIAVCTQAIHITADGRRFVVMHGHEFDGNVKSARWLQQLGGARTTGSSGSTSLSTGCAVLDRHFRV